MNLADDEMLRRLVARDGPMAARSWRHTDAAGNCRYADFYPEGDCPWCAADVSRLAAVTKEGLVRAERAAR